MLVLLMKDADDLGSGLSCRDKMIEFELKSGVMSTGLIHGEMRLTILSVQFSGIKYITMLSSAPCIPLTLFIL